MHRIVAITLLLTASPALAATTAVTEPSAAALFALGVVGVIIGRAGSKRRKD